MIITVAILAQDCTEHQLRSSSWFCRPSTKKRATIFAHPAVLQRRNGELKFVRSHRVYRSHVPSKSMVWCMRCGLLAIAGQHVTKWTKPWKQTCSWTRTGSSTSRWFLYKTLYFFINQKNKILLNIFYLKFYWLYILYN